MRVTIWQQFSSNHSSHFTVVGRFQTEDQAQEASEKVRQLLKSIVEWREADPDWAEIYYDEDIPKPPELEFGEEYGVKWSVPIDWIRSAEDIVEALRVVKNDVFVMTPPWEVNDTSQPIKELLVKLGGLAYRQEVGNHYIFLSTHITCYAPDETLAQSLFEEIDTYLQSRRGFAPWEAGGEYMPGGARGKAQRNDRQLIVDLQFWHLGQALPALITYLEKHGCTDIEYTLTAEPA